jgi:hypothetical protein
MCMVHRSSETDVQLHHNTKLPEPKIHFPGYDEEIGTPGGDEGVRWLLGRG